MHFHGTADSTVPYFFLSSPTISPVDSTIQSMGKQHNNCNLFIPDPLQLLSSIQSKLKI